MVDNPEVLSMLQDPQHLQEELLFSVPEASVHRAVNKTGVVLFENVNSYSWMHTRFCLIPVLCMLVMYLRIFCVRIWRL